jgi:hypothetical protein
MWVQVPPAPPCYAAVFHLSSKQAKDNWIDVGSTPIRRSIFEAVYRSFPKRDRLSGRCRFESGQPLHSLHFVAHPWFESTAATSDAENRVQSGTFGSSPVARPAPGFTLPYRVRLRSEIP